MTHQPLLSPFASPFLRIDLEQKSFAYSLESLRSCCAEAREASVSGRYSRAHELFQNALVEFDRARNVTWDASEDVYLWQHTWQLSRARAELDECATLIYTPQVAQGSCPWPAAAEGKTE